MIYPGEQISFNGRSYPAAVSSCSLAWNGVLKEFIRGSER